jgi:hypothetical protein
LRSAFEGVATPAGFNLDELRYHREAFDRGEPGSGRSLGEQTTGTNQTWRSLIASPLN